MFTYHDENTAPAASVPIIQKSKAAFGFLPNLHKILAEAPATYEAYTSLYNAATTKISLTPIEAQVVMMASNVRNECHYCTAGHSMLMTMIKTPQDVIDSLRDKKPIKDPKLQALRVYAEQLLEHRGHIGDDQLQAFLNAGYNKQQALEVLVALAAKLISNFTNAIAHTELDEPAKAYAWAKQA
jgi:alkylhydroperoxidase family enzyme